MSKDKLSRDEAIQRLGPRDYFKAVLYGRISTKAEITRESLERILADIQEICAKEENGQAYNSQVYIACIELPFGDPRVKFLTTFHNGQLGKNIKDLDADILERDGFVGARSLEHLLEEVFSGCALPGVPAIKETKKKPTGSGGVPPTYVPKPAYPIIIDPAVVEYLRNHKGYLVAEAFSHVTTQKGKKIDTFAELTELGVSEDLLQRAQDAGFLFSLQSNIDFIKASRKKILRIHRKRVNALLTMPSVTTLISKYMQSIRLERNYREAFEYLAQSSNVRSAYEFFSHTDHRIPNVEIEEIFDALRSSALEMVHNSRDTDLEERVRMSMAWWISVAKAAEVIEKDELIGGIVPFFEKTRAKTYDATPNHVYDGMMALTANMINRNLQYSSNELDFILGGLWLKGLLPKRGEIETQATHDSRTLFGESDRELAGLARQYGFPIKHLMRRFTSYDPVLWSEFENLLKKGKIPKELKLQSALEDYRLGMEIYNAIPLKTREKTFRSLKGDEPLAAPDGERGTMIEGILTYYIGSQRSRFQEAVRSYHEQRPRTK